MLRTIIYREFLSNIITFRFLMGFLVCVGLVATNTYVIVKLYEEQNRAHSRGVQRTVDRIRGIRVYSELEKTRRPQAWKSPNLLSLLLNDGVESQVGDSIQVSHGWDPVFTPSESFGTYHEIRVVHLSMVFQIVVGLLAFLFAYDVVAGERENGTLALSLSNSVPRGVLLWGKYLGGACSVWRRR